MVMYVKYLACDSVEISTYVELVMSLFTHGFSTTSIDRKRLLCLLCSTLHLGVIGAVPALLKKVLQWQNTSLMELSLTALFILSSCSASALHNLSTCPEIIPSILISGGLTTVSQLIYQSEKSPELVENALSLLDSMVSLSGVALNQASKIAIMIPMLVEAVEEGSAARRQDSTIDMQKLQREVPWFDLE